MMKRFECLLIAALACSAATHATAAGQPAPALPAPELAAYVQGAVDALLEEHEMAGVMVAVTGADGPWLVEGYGLANAETGQEADADTLFRVGSIAKTFIWTAAMMLVDRGELDLDRDVNDYLREVQVAEAFDAPVTMRHLMTHTAGFEDTFRIFVVSDDDPRSSSELLAQTQPKRVSAPGTRGSYSNWGSNLAAQVVGDIAGVPYEQFLQREILDPLGLDSTTLAVPSAMPAGLAGRFAPGHRRAAGRLEPAPDMQFASLGASGAMAMTAVDAARWMHFHLNGGELEGVRLMSRTTHERMLSPALGESLAVAGRVHGFGRRAVGDVERFGHSGATYLSNAMFWFAPESGIGVFVAANTRHGDVAQPLANQLFDHLTGARAPGLPAPPDAVELAIYEGGYLTNRRSFTTLMSLAGRATLLDIRAEPDDGGALLVPVSGQTRRFVPVSDAPELFQADDGTRIRFLREGGAIVAVEVPTGTQSFERASGIDRVRTLLLVGGTSVLLAVTTLLGLWRRWRYRPETTDPGRLASTVAVTTAVITLVYAVIFAVAVASLGAVEWTGDMRFPPAPVAVWSAAGWAVAAAALAMLVGLYFAWRGSDWGWWRRLHHTAFALTLAASVWLLWHWQLYGAPII